ncbi:MAG: hypothetical protein C0424_02000 [Sphingobacteriaceae bacterium]|nr:hypothetical protein [Sphingobacteriaceae bacterium]
MNLGGLIHDIHWFSVELVMLQLYPDVEEWMDDYREVFDQLKQMPAEKGDFELVLGEERCIGASGEDVFYTSLWGRPMHEAAGAQHERFALEYLEWTKWLGMEIAEACLEEYAPAEIIAHSLHEMTFVAFNEADIQAQFKELMGRIEALEQMTPEQRDQELLSLEELLKKLDEMKGEE